MELEKYIADFSLLPPHVITRILGFLNIDDLKNASMVSKSWYYASTDPQIERTLVLFPQEDHFPNIFLTNRKYRILSLRMLYFDETDSYYYELFEKFGPFVKILEIISGRLKRYQLLKLLEHTTSLQAISFCHCSQFTWPGLIPLDYDNETINRISKSLLGVKRMCFIQITNISIIAGFLQYTPNLEKCEICLDLFNKSFDDFFTIFHNYNASSLRYLYLNLKLTGSVDEFIKNFLKIENLNLKSLSLFIRWDWDSGIYKSSLFRQFIIKLHSLEEFIIDVSNGDQLKHICQHLKHLKSLECQLQNELLITKLANLKQLERLRYKVESDCYDQYQEVLIIEIDKFFQCKFENLRVFYFEEFVTEKNLKQFCENHPNLIELKLTCLITTNLEIIFKNLTKLRVLDIHFGFYWLTEDDMEKKDLSYFDENRDYEYKLSRLQDLEVLNLSERVSGIREDDVQQLKKLRSTNLTFN